MRPVPDPAGPGQESVWSYPRPAVARRSGRHVRIEHGGATVADTRAAVRTLETSHPPSWYVPPADVAIALLRRSERRSFCEWKGEAVYWHLVVGDAVLRDVAWSYPDPTAAFAILRDHLAFYAGPLDRCTIDGAVVRPQPGGFYGGWITADLAGPFKGVPGSLGW
ncbi:DUF427 domain-containing protein [Sphingomonas corticis]|jgi:uncharacterized protein (DUF427 family)|uniref:DUF427 domain-containing protein n=1 Tax=Sphingomonas corticis TaxID=2722791 RepID=A0ABX1CQ18_9SPHN|nr:DUF427 domain-containing protein [Sphingomonas corticis]NJR79999.1 DUF427 domain-containing protein [Sphingomonas corticis]